MAVKSKSTPDPNEAAIKRAIIQAVDELLEQHGPDVKRVRRESEDDTVTVGFKALIDCSESEPTVTVDIRYSQAVTDRRVAKLDNPDQIQLFDKKELAKINKAKKEEAAAAAAEAGDN